MKSNYPLVIILFSLLLLPASNGSHDMSKNVHSSNVPPVFNKMKSSFEELSGVVHQGGVKYIFPVSYNKTLGFLTSTPGAFAPFGKNANARLPRLLPGRIMTINDRMYLPQLNPIKDYEPFDIQSSGDWISWIYQSMGIGADYGERIYAYNVVTHKELGIWRQKSGTNEQLMAFEMVGSVIYYGTQSSRGNQVDVMIHSTNLNKDRGKVLITSKGTGNQRVIGDFSVAGSDLGIIWVPAYHFSPNGSFFESEPYTMTINHLTGQLLRQVYSGINVNPFDMSSRNGIFVWSDRTTGVHCYSLASNQVWLISDNPSYVMTDGRYVWMRGINDYQMDGFDTRTQKYVRFPELNNDTSVINSGSIDCFINGYKYAWISIKY